MEKKNTVWIVENMWDCDDGPTVNIQVCATKEVAARTFAAIVADEVAFWRNDLGLPITDDMLKESNSYEYDYDTQKFTPCGENTYPEDFSITVERDLFDLSDLMSYRSTSITMYAQTVIEQDITTPAPR